MDLLGIRDTDGPFQGWRDDLNGPCLSDLCAGWDPDEWVD